MKILDAFLFLFISLSVNFAQQNSKEVIKSKLFDAPAAAYKLDASDNGRGFEFRNNSNVSVLKIRLGCVIKKSGGIKVLSERSFVDVNLAPPKDNLVNTFLWDSNHGFFPVEECRKGTLAIAEAELEENKIWKLGAE